MQERHILRQPSRWSKGVQPLEHYVQEHQVFGRDIVEEFERRIVKQPGMRRVPRRKVAVEDTGFRHRGVQEVVL